MWNSGSLGHHVLDVRCWDDLGWCSLYGIRKFPAQKNKDVYCLQFHYVGVPSRAFSETVVVAQVFGTRVWFQ